MSVSQIKVRRDTAANWAATNTVLASGEFGLDTTNDVLKIGDGITPFLSLAQVGKEPTIATQEEAEAGQINEKFMTPLRTAEAIAELAQGGVTFNETVIVADYSLGLEDVGSLRLVANKAGTILYETDPAAVSSMQEDYYQSGFFFPFSVNFTSLEEEGEGLWTLEHNAENLGEGGYFTYALYPMLSPNDFQKATRVRLFNAAGEVVADMHNPQNTWIFESRESTRLRFTIPESFATMNVNGTPGMYEPLYIRSMELTFDALPVTITIPSDETASLPIGSEIQVQRLGDSPVIFEGGTAVEPEFIRYQPIPGANPAAFAVAIEPVTSVNQWNESVSTRPWNGFRINLLNSFVDLETGQPVYQNLTQQDLQRATSVRLYDTEGELLADIINFGENVVSRAFNESGQIQQFRGARELSFLSPVILDSDDGENVVTVGDIELSFDPLFLTSPTIKANKGHYIPINGTAKLVKVAGNTWSLTMSDGVNLLDRFSTYYDQDLFYDAMLITAKESGSTVIINAQSWLERSTMFIFSDDFPVGGQIIFSSMNTLNNAPAGVLVTGNAIFGSTLTLPGTEDSQALAFLSGRRVIVTKIGNFVSSRLGTGSTLLIPTFTVVEIDNSFEF